LGTTQRPPVSDWPVEALDQGEEPPAPGDGSGEKGVTKKSNHCLGNAEDSPDAPACDITLPVVVAPPVAPTPAKTNRRHTWGSKRHAPCYRRKAPCHIEIDQSGHLTAKAKITEGGLGIMTGTGTGKP